MKDQQQDPIYEQMKEALDTITLDVQKVIITVEKLDGKKNAIRFLGKYDEEIMADIMAETAKQLKIATEPPTSPH